MRIPILILGSKRVKMSMCKDSRYHEKGLFHQIAQIQVKLIKTCILMHADVFFQYFGYQPQIRNSKPFHSSGTDTL